MNSKKVEYGILQKNPPIPPIKEKIPNSLRNENSAAPNEAPNIGIMKVRDDIKVVSTSEVLNILDIIKDAIIGLNRSTKNSDRFRIESRVNDFFKITKKIPVKEPARIPKVKNKSTLFNFFLPDIFIE